MAPTSSPLSEITAQRDDLAGLRDLLEHRRLLPLLPLIYVAWANGELVGKELATLREIATRQAWLDEDACEVLNRWLDPDDPPTPVELQYLLHAIEESSDTLSEAERLTLADLGAEMATFYREEDEEGFSFPVDEVQAALDDLEEALGLVGVEAARQLRKSIEKRPAPTPVVHPTEPTFDAEAMKQLLDGSHSALRDDIRDLLASDDFLYSYGQPLDEAREQVMVWMQKLVEAGYGEKCFPQATDGHRDLSEFLAIFETLGIFDLSLLVKFGVHFGLFGGSIMFLGTEEHHEKYLPDTASLKVQGCYAMTEMGRGSNVRDLETIARYDSDSDEFVIHTPTETARKEWIGGAGQTATMATVYAQLIVDDENYGVHALLVPIRDDNGEVLAGIRIEDQGLKMGLNGVDNGRIWFDHVRVPRKNLLNRHGGVDENGIYQSVIPSPNRRFFTMLGTLVAGRLGVSAAGISAAKSALAIATRYGANRRQFGPAGRAEIPILDYRMHQRALMPRIAEAFALTFGLHEVMDRYNDPDNDDRRRTEALAAGLKAYSSDFAVHAVQTARECCGGQGYLTLNRLAAIRTDVDVFVTFEGANVVMRQQVARACLADFRSELADGNIFTLARLLARQARRSVSEANPVVARNTDPDHLRSADFQVNAFRYREKDLLIGVARRIKRRIDDGMDSFLAFNDCQDHAVALANAHLERFLLEAFVDVEQACEDEELREVLSRVRNLFALSLFEKDCGWFLENGYLQATKARAIRDQVNQLCAEVRDDALTLVESFGVPDSCLSAPIAFAEGKAPADSRIEFARGVNRGAKKPKGQGSSKST